MGAVLDHRHVRGFDLLLAHCTAVADEASERAPAFARLEALLGGDLARLLVFALAGHGRRASSSP